MKNKKDNKNIVFIMVLLVIVAVSIFFFPKINEIITNKSMPKLENTESKKETEERKIDEDIIETIHYPLMRNSIYSVNTYYSLDKFKVSDMINTDILLNAFLSIENVMIKPLGINGTCTNQSLYFDAKWIGLRIKNILGKTVSYNLDNFYVPEDINRNYMGNWIYDRLSNRFVYDGICISLATPATYYDLTKLIKLDYVNKDSNDIKATYYVGFAKVEGNTYSIYSDTAMTNLVTSGTFENSNKLKATFENLDKNTLNKFGKYEYLFKDTLCSYNEYCLYEGKWIHE